jgi:hypothetical protein
MPPIRSCSRAPRFLRHGLFAIAAAVLFALAFGVVVMIAWNAVIPAVFALPALSYWQALAALVLARVLVGRFSHGPGHHWSRHAHPCHADHPGHLYEGLYEYWWEEGEEAFRSYRQRRQTGDAEDGR